jgi:hypothetical protein
MVGIESLLILLPVIVYYAGKLINQFVKEELIGKEKLLQRLVYLAPIIPLILGVAGTEYTINQVILAGLISVVPLIVSKNKLEKYHYSINNILLGLMIGVNLDNYLVILGITAYFYFTSNLDYYSKDKSLVKRRLLEHGVFLAFGLASNFLVITELSFAASAAMTVLYVKESLAKKR